MYLCMTCSEMKDYIRSAPSDGHTITMWSFLCICLLHAKACQGCARQFQYNIMRISSNNYGSPAENQGQTPIIEHLKLFVTAFWNRILLFYFRLFREYLFTLNFLIEEIRYNIYDIHVLLHACMYNTFTIMYSTQTLRVVGTEFIMVRATTGCYGLFSLEPKHLCVCCFSAVVLLWIATHMHKLEPLAYLQRRQESSQKLTCFFFLPNGIIYGPQTSVLGQEESSNRALLVLRYLEVRFPATERTIFTLFSATKHYTCKNSLPTSPRWCRSLEVLFPISSGEEFCIQVYFVLRKTWSK